MMAMPQPPPPPQQQQQPHHHNNDDGGHDGHPHVMMNNGGVVTNENNMNGGDTNNNENDFLMNNNTNLSTLALQQKLSQLRNQSNESSQKLTQKLATSQSGQNLLHIGSSLSSLPPDLHLLLQKLHPLLSNTENYEKLNKKNLIQIINLGNIIRNEQRRVSHTIECSNLYQDLLSAEHDVKQYSPFLTNEQKKQNSQYLTDEQIQDQKDREIDYVSSLERAAHSTLCLVHDLQLSTSKVSSMTSSSNKGNIDRQSSAASSVVDASDKNPTVLPSMRTPLPEDTEQAQFLMKLSPRIRRLESNTIICLTKQLEHILNMIKENKQQDAQQGGDENKNVVDFHTFEQQNNEHILQLIGYCMRGLALLGRGKEIESSFSRIVIMPLIRSKLTLGNLDSGGKRGECKGLSNLLEDLVSSITNKYGYVIQYSEMIFNNSNDTSNDIIMNITASTPSKNNPNKKNIKMDVDLITNGVWVPIATALMADASIRMSILSPGIASVLQSNYIIFESFLSKLSYNLLNLKTEDNGKDNAGSSNISNLCTMNVQISKDMIVKAQKRIYSHQITVDFNKKWNLPIYYQLRFGESCTRLNVAIEKVCGTYVDETKKKIQDSTHSSSATSDYSDTSGSANNNNASSNNAAVVPEEKLNISEDVYTGDEKEDDSSLSDNKQLTFKLPLFKELYDILKCLWKEDVILPSLTHRFVRGSIQLVGRLISFIKEKMESSGADKKLSDNINDVILISWDLYVLDTMLKTQYINIIVNGVFNSDTTTTTSNDQQQQQQKQQLRIIVSDLITDGVCKQISPIVVSSWNEIIVNILIKKCSMPLAAVKGVAATYRMTNRPPPNQASPFVSTILRPLKQIIDDYTTLIPSSMIISNSTSGGNWKSLIVSTVSERYSIAVEELIVTVQRTESALKNRKVRPGRAGGGAPASGGATKMSDGEKVKLQLYLDYMEYKNVIVKDIGIVDCEKSISGIAKLKTLTIDGEELYKQQQQIQKR